MEDKKLKSFNMKTLVCHTGQVNYQTTCTDFIKIFFLPSPPWNSFSRYWKHFSFQLDNSLDIVVGIFVYQHVSCFAPCCYGLYHHESCCQNIITMTLLHTAAGANTRGKKCHHKYKLQTQT